MKKIFKSVALMLALTLIIGLFPMNTQAASPKLSKTSISLTVGESTTLKVKNYKKKVKWSSTNKSVATVSSSGKVKAVSDGYAYIIAKAGKKVLTCVVEVKEKTTVSEDKLEVRYKQNNRYTIAFVKNNNKETVSIQGKMVSFDSNGTMLDTSTDYDYCVAPGDEVALYFLNPEDENYHHYIPASFKVNWTVEKSYYKSYVSDIDYKMDITNKIVVEVTNNSSKKLDFIEVVCVQYDSNGNVTDYDYHFAHCESPNTTDYLSFDFGYDEHYDDIIPTSCEIYINFAY